MSEIQTYEPLDLSKLMPPMNVIKVLDGAGLDKLADFFKRETEIGFDYETNVVENWTYRRPRTMQFGNRNEQYVIDLLAFAQNGGVSLMDGLGWYKYHPAFSHVVNVVRPVIEGRSHLKIGHSLQFEYEQSKFGFGMRMQHLYCTHVAESVIKAGYVHPKSSEHFSLEGVVKNRLGFQIDKTLQTSFDLESVLTEEQYLYAAFDTRVVFPIRTKQLHTIQQDRLGRAVQIENDCVGAFVDIKLNGIYCNPEKWQPLLDEAQKEHTQTIAELDSHFIPVVGRKEDKKPPSEEELRAFESRWRNLGYATPEEKLAKKEFKLFLKVQREELKRHAKVEYDSIRKRERDVKKHAKESLKYEGEAAINYSSKDQVREALLQMKGFTEQNLRDTSDDTLAKHASKKVVAAIRKYRKTEKKLDSYGDAWIRCYPDTPEGKPSKEAGFVNPKTGRLHSIIDPLATETGRSSSRNPNIQQLPKDKRYRACFTSVAGRKTSTVDMSGAELRIIAEDSGAQVWIDAFNKKWDVHSVGTELLYGEKWKVNTILEETQIEVDGKLLTLPPCAYYTQDHKKCECPLHKEQRDKNKAVNFQIAYGGTKYALADELDIDVHEADKLLGMHQQAFPEIWDYLDASGDHAKKYMENRTMFDRRRGFTRPTSERVKQLLEKDKKKVDSNAITHKMKQMMGSIERAGKNSKVQGTNADIIKLAMGAGYDKDGKPFLWHIIEPELHAVLINMVHDELVADHSEELGNDVANAIGDAFRRAAAEVFTKIEMDYEANVGDYWKK